MVHTRALNVTQYGSANVLIKFNFTKMDKYHPYMTTDQTGLLTHPESLSKIWHMLACSAAGPVAFGFEDQSGLADHF